MDRVEKWHPGAVHGRRVASLVAPASASGAQCIWPACHLLL